MFCFRKAYIIFSRTIGNHTHKYLMLENQLFAPTLKGVIDFGCAELASRAGLGSSHPLGLRG